MFNKQLLRDHYGQFYKIHTSREMPVPDALESQQFHSALQAYRFINGLVTTSNYWKSLYFSESITQDQIKNEIDLKNKVAKLLFEGRVKVFKVVQPLSGNHSSKRTLTNSSKDLHIFTSATNLLLNTPDNIMHFSNKDDAEKIILALSPDSNKLKDIVAELGLIEPPYSDNINELTDTLTNSLVSGEVVIVVKKYSTPPKSEAANDEEVTSDKDATEGPEVAAATTATESEQCNCTISSLSAKCSHGRSHNNKGKLQIVPSPSQSKSEEYELMGVKVTLKKEYAGEDKINCSVDLQNNKGDGCFFITDKSGELVNSSTSEIPIKGEASTNKDKWPINATPTTTTIQGHGCDKAGKTITLETFPNQYYTVQADLQIFKDWSDKVNKGWEAWGNTIFSMSPVELAPKITGPTGSFAANWGWKEDNDWRAYYNISTDFGLNPILGLEIKIILSMATLALTAAGIPPNIAKFTAKHLLDLQFSAGANCKAALTGKPCGKFYADGDKKITGEGKFSSEGGVVLEILARAGSDYIVSASLSVSGEAKVSGEDILSLDETGLYLQTNILLSPFIGTARVQVKYFKIRTKTKEEKWQPWKQIDIYKSDKKKLLPR